MLGNFRILNEKKLHKQHEMYMANANHTLAYPTETIFHWLTLGLTLGPQGLAFGPNGLALGLPGFLDTNILVKVTQNRCVGGQDQCETPMRVV